MAPLFVPGGSLTTALVVRQHLYFGRTANAPSFYQLVHADFTFAVGGGCLHVGYTLVGVRESKEGFPQGSAANQTNQKANNQDVTQAR